MKRLYIVSLTALCAVYSHTENLINRYTDGEVGSVWKALLKKCKSGDIQAIKLYFELKGKYGDKAAQKNDAKSHGVIIMPAVMTDDG